MSQENVDLVRAVHPLSGTKVSDLFNEGADGSALEALASLLTPDFEVVAGSQGSGIWVEDRRLDGLLRTWREWLEPWEEYWTEVEEFVDAGRDHVLVLVRDRGRLRGSDAEVELLAASVWTLRDGKIARVEFHTSRDEALEAVGLSE
ncbi:MAG: nuclear transport factor 2 family protein [Acidobacteriota bacterium]